MTEKQTPIAVSVEDACERTALGRTYMWSKIRSGEVASYRVGRRVLIRIEDLDKWIRSHKTAQQEKA